MITSFCANHRKHLGMISIKNKKNVILINVFFKRPLFNFFHNEKKDYIVQNTNSKI
jgi:hypothetical protein